MTTAKRILCAVDFSPPSLGALRYASDLARDLRAELVVLHVIAPPDYPTSLFAADTVFPELHHHQRDHAAAELARAHAEVADGVAARTAIREGVPHEQILAEAAASGCDLIVVATHARNDLEHALLGGTAERIVRESRVPVLTRRHS